MSSPADSLLPASRLAAEHSFVVPAYGDSPFLAGCLASLRAQTLGSRLVLTTSTPSPFIDKAAAEFGVEVLVNPQKAGIAADWNFALAATGARLVTLAHQDDVYFPRFLERSLELLSGVPDAALCFTAYQEIDDAGAPKSSKVSLAKHLLERLTLGSVETVRGARLRAFLSFGNPLPCSSVTFNRRRLASFEFSGDYASNLDWDAWLRLEHSGETFLRAAERLVGRRHNPLTATSQLIRDGRRKQEDLRIFQRLWPAPLDQVIAYAYRAGY
jgi:glycosyltransferase involved in cell wall biosynthesis